MLTSQYNIISDFLNCEVFSEKFHDVLQNYFSIPQNLQPILDNILPLAHVERETSDPPSQTQDSQIAETKARTVQEEKENEGIVTTTLSLPVNHPTGPSDSSDVPLDDKNNKIYSQEETQNYS